MSRSIGGVTGSGAARRPPTRRHAHGLATGIALLGCLCFAQARAARAEQPIEGESEQAVASGALGLVIETPLDGASIASADPRVFIAGQVTGALAQAVRFDIVIVIDRSKSTDAPTGVDIDGDGWIGRAPDSRYTDSASDDPGDSVLAAEVIAARALLEQLDPATTRVALAAFSGDSKPETPDAEMLAPLSADHALARRALDELLEARPSGRTNLSDAIDVSTAELLRARPWRGGPGEPRKLVLLMSDGQPTLPVPFDTEASAQAAFESARRAAARGIRIDTFAIGREIARRLDVPQRISDLSGGKLTEVREPRDLVSTFEALRLVDVSAVEVHNRTSGEQADAVLIEADGRFAALVALREGANQLEIRARSSEGRWTRRELTVERIASQELQPMQPRWLEQRARLLERRLADLRQRQLRIETGQAQAEAERRIRVATDVPAAAERRLEVIAEPPEELPAAPDL